MDAPRRRQHHSCDQCRKGKRACNASTAFLPQESDQESFAISGESGHTGPCSNCLRLGRNCTFNWLRSQQSKGKEKHRKKKEGRAQSKQPEPDKPYTESSCQHPSSNIFSPTVISTGNVPFNFFGPLQPPPLDLEWTDLDIHELDMPEYCTAKEPSGKFPGSSPSASTEQSNHFCTGSPSPLVIPDPEVILNNPMNNSVYSFYTERKAPGSHTDVADVYWPDAQDTPQAETVLAKARNKKVRISQARRTTWLPCSSNKLTENHARSATTQNLLRIYHDSMENALSCWLTEQNCPYSGVIGQGHKKGLLLNSLRKEWGPNWSNRICARVCQLDRASSVIRGRSLTVMEERAASKALHTTIMAFATQWTHLRKERGIERGGPSDASEDISDNSDLGSIKSSVPNRPTQHQHQVDTEHSVQESLWNQARQSLEASTEVPSFRVVFANIIFSLVQRPLNFEEHIKSANSRRSGGAYTAGQSCRDKAQESAFPNTRASNLHDLEELNELFEHEYSPQFLETALRQLFFYRYKQTRLVRQYHGPGVERSRSTNQHQLHSPLMFSQNEKEISRDQSNTEPDMLNLEDRETFNLLFWLGVMFDTLTSAMHQRPLVVSDEDSEIRCSLLSIQPQTSLKKTATNLGGWGSWSSKIGEKENNLWGDYLLQKETAKRLRNSLHWPCSYEEATEILSDAAPVKVLLFRRVTSLQTLVYRGAAAERLEEVFDDTLKVYQHWNRTYGRFMRQCVAHHEELAPRIQSWYIILAGHWHLAAILLADTLENIDNSGMGLHSQSERRGAIDLVGTLKRENAIAISDIAKCSLHEQNSSFTSAHEFHDVVNEGAFLTEPWTAVLIRSFTRAGYILLDQIGMSPHGIHITSDIASQDAGRRCKFCIDALFCLGRKSGMASLAAVALSNSLGE